MGANIFWEPAKRSRKELSTSAPSSFMEIMRNTFDGDYKWQLDEGDLRVLVAMSNASRDEGFKETISEIIKAIDKHNSIIISAEF